ncbi:hypothetical protein MKX07_001258 [Trichoderma sp. CBMAI-0711]|uniref:Uncharacterized protein n=1 Tax=Trichoderma parareesei TaxID=858221 RepID=A0A2H3A557_TRIPA|nr:hypothetical protein MKX07_001258 [Trichoderma sp. CBMAI-0711]OTA07795.1 hypothetical protein A9Z42_0087280 [Trichoderma parareesei]
MALSGLFAMEHILDMLRIYRNGRESASIFRDLANWFFLMSASYAIRTLHYSPPVDTTADATLLVSGCLALRSTCQLFHIGIRSLVITRCQNIVISLMFRVLSGDVDRQDVESLHGYWFRGLSLFRVEERISLPVEREFRSSCGYVAPKSLPTPGYVIPEDS